MAKGRSLSGKLNIKAQGIMGIPYSMIFAIILMIVFVSVFSYAIYKFLEWKNCAMIGVFKSDLQSEVKSAYSSQSARFQFTGTLPANIEKVCFADFSKKISGADEEVADDIWLYEGKDANMFLYPTRNSCKMPFFKINHIDLTRLTEMINPYCIDSDDRSFTIEIDKRSNEPFVRIS